ADEGVDAAARGGVALAEGSVAGTFAADDVEGFQGEAGRIDLRVAGGAGGIAAVLGELLADGGGPTDVRFDGRNVRRRRLRRLPEQPVEHEGAARHRRCRR